MRTAMALAAVLATGCIVHSHDDEFGGSPAHVAASWEFRNIANEQATACPPNHTTHVVSQQIDSNGEALTNPVDDIFDCDDGYGVTKALAPDLQAVWIEIRDNNSGALYATTPAAAVDLYYDDATFDAVLLNDGGYFAMQWIANCGAAGGIDAINAVSSDANGSVVDQFTCEGHNGITGGFIHGNYKVSVEAQSHGQTISRSAPISADILDRNQVTDLGTIVLD